MNRTTIDFGIDLGTTNSAIAILRGRTSEIIKNNLENDITASAVFIDKLGQVQIGIRAKQRLEDKRYFKDVFIEFKRRMGESEQFEFKNSGRIMKPEELSAEVLKSLRGDVQQRFREEIQAAVITVPAAFEQKQCAATKKAGEMAGLLQCPLLQEPVAAALAYGFQADVTKEYWLIYDFGGGTFDAAIMKAEDGTITVVNHGGDNFLGGADIDWAAMENLVLPEIRKNYNFPELRRGNDRWRPTLAKIKRAVEEAKIQLSRSDTTYLQGCDIEDAEGQKIEIDFKLTRDTLAGVAEPIIMRSIDICKRILKEKKLDYNAIEKLILVGGPTLAPYFREILQANLGIPLDFSVDPLTVVARGAAVFAGTQRLEGRMTPRASAGQFNIDISYEPIGADEDPAIRGTVVAASGLSVEGFTIEFINQQTYWRSGKILLKKNGGFKLNLLAEKGCQNIFAIELLDPKGRRQIVVPDSLTYTIGMVISEQLICNSLAVALNNNEKRTFFAKGEPYPATKTIHDFHTTHSLRKGETSGRITIPVVEGENGKADRNRLLGQLTIKGTEVRRDVPAGSEIEITLGMKEPGVILVKAFVPILDEEFEATLDYHEDGPDPERLQQEYVAEIDRVKVIRDRANQAEDETVARFLAEVNDSNAFEAIENLLDAAKGDRIAANNAEKRLLEIKIKIDQVEDALEWPALLADVNRRLNELYELLEEHGTSEQRQKANKLRNQVEELITQKRIDPLRRRIEQVVDLHRDVLFEQPGFWLGFFNDLNDEQENMNDKTTAKRLFSQGQQCIAQGNVQGLRSVVAQLLDLIPQNIAEEIKRGHISSLQ